jgi:hypothetical protein
MSETTSVIVVTVSHSNSVSARNIEAGVAVALCLDADLRESAIQWPPRVDLVLSYHSNGEERVRYRDNVEWAERFL